MDDARGISRGRCKNCSSCGGYIPPSSGLKCSQCGCRPAGHSRLDQSLQSQQGDTSIRDNSTGDTFTGDTFTQDTSTGDTSTWTRDTCTDQSHVALPISNSFASPLNIQSSPISSLCGFPNCNQAVDFDLNSGMESIHCRSHKTASMGMYVEDIEDNQFRHGNQYQDSSMFSMPQDAQDNSLCIIPECFQPKYMDSGTGVLYDYCGKTHAQEGKMRGILPNIQDGAALLPTPVQAPVVPTSRATCAIAECPNARYVDESGTVHECCGITHAMEHQRRQALWQQVNQQVVKGVTHCLLPGCNKNTWPFENYCGRTHANLGLQQGLVAPPPVAGTATASQAGPKDSSSCIIPGCQKPKFVDSSTGATYDYCGKSHADEGKRRGIYATADKVEDQCGLPGCTNRRKTEGGTVHDYCCLDHAQKDAPNRDARILTSMPEVQKFLQKFPILKVASMKENDHAKPGGALFNKFRSAMMSLPTSQRNTCLAFHGTAESNIDSICTTGYDQKKRSGQAHGAGEYFATSPNTPLSYCKGGKKLLLNELLLGQNGTHHTKHGDIVVMKNPAHDLPRFVITFK